MNMAKSYIEQISSDGLKFLSELEGRVHRAYRCPAGVVTIGEGFTMSSRIFAAWAMRRWGRPLQMGDGMTDDEIDQVLLLMIDEEYAPPTASALMPQRQAHLDGAVSVVWNCGRGALKWRWARALAAGDVTRAAEFLRKTAVTANGRKLPGLVRRRRLEARLIESGVYFDSGSGDFGKNAINADAETVRWVQRGLRDLGYYRAALDGIAGTKTQSAVRRFQEANGLIVDGIAGQATRATLARVLDSRRGTNVSAASGGGAAIGGLGGDAISPEAIIENSMSAIDFWPWLVAGVALALTLRVMWWLWCNRGRWTGHRSPA